MNIKEIYNSQTALIIELQNSLSIMAGAKISAKDLLRTHRVERTMIKYNDLEIVFKDCIEAIRLAFDAIEESITEAEWQRKVTGKMIIEQHLTKDGLSNFELSNIFANETYINFSIFYEGNPQRHFLSYSIISNTVVSRN